MHHQHIIYSLQSFFFFLGVLVTIIYYSDIYSFLMWVKNSLMEDGKASGKSLSAMALVILFISISLFVCRQGYIGKEDFKPNQKEIINNIINTIQYLIIVLYGIKWAGKVSISKIASAFSKGEKEEDDTTNKQQQNNNQQPTGPTGPSMQA